MARIWSAGINIVPADYQTAVEPNINNKGSNSGQTGTNPFMSMQDRLRQLGASYYLLETWGNQRQFFRFYCQMAVGGNSSYTRYFEAINPNPLEAMADVLRRSRVLARGRLYSSLILDRHISSLPRYCVAAQ